MKKYLTLKQAAAEVPGRPHISTLHRWRTAGVAGLKLPTTKIAGRRFVEAGELEDFLAAIAAAADEQPRPARTTKRREAEIAEAESYLDAIGIGGGSGRADRDKREGNDSGR